MYGKKGTRNPDTVVICHMFKRRKERRERERSSPRSNVLSMTCLLLLKPTRERRHGHPSAALRKKERKTFPKRWPEKMYVPSVAFQRDIVRQRKEMVTRPVGWSVANTSCWGAEERETRRVPFPCHYVKIIGWHSFVQKD